MSDAYYRIGNIYGADVLIEIKGDDAGIKSVVLDTIRSGEVTPKYIAVDVNENAKYFEQEYPKIDLKLIRLNPKWESAPKQPSNKT